MKCKFNNGLISDQVFLKTGLVLHYKHAELLNECDIKFQGFQPNGAWVVILWFLKNSLKIHGVNFFDFFKTFYQRSANLSGLLLSLKPHVAMSITPLTIVSLSE